MKKVIFKISLVSLLLITYSIAFASETAKDKTKENKKVEKKSAGNEEVDPGVLPSSTYVPNWIKQLLGW